MPAAYSLRCDRSGTFELKSLKPGKGTPDHRRRLLTLQEDIELKAGRVLRDEESANQAHTLAGTTVKF